ncbi:hypothetical protein [Thiocapsa rosea]|uniref:hypothetical protein n=1 Tax=Thiocapsa rosea TaxID=69360 RepID=UPI001FE89976|nr:hypothetical protein [Thiocapsa rosea]
MKYQSHASSVIDPEDDRWHVQLAPYLWLPSVAANLDLEVGVRGQVLIPDTRWFLPLGTASAMASATQTAAGCRYPRQPTLNRVRSDMHHFQVVFGLGDITDLGGNAV